MVKAVMWFAALSLIFGTLTVFFFPLVGLAVVFSCFTLASVALHSHELLRTQIVEIATAHFERLDDQGTSK